MNFVVYNNGCCGQDFHSITKQINLYEDDQLNKSRFLNIVILVSIQKM